MSMRTSLCPGISEIPKKQQRKSRYPPEQLVSMSAQATSSQCNEALEGGWSGCHGLFAAQHQGRGCLRKAPLYPVWPHSACCWVQQFIPITSRHRQVGTCRCARLGTLSAKTKKKHHHTKKTTVCYKLRVICTCTPAKPRRTCPRWTHPKIPTPKWRYHRRGEWS